VDSTLEAQPNSMDEISGEQVGGSYAATDAGTREWVAFDVDRDALLEALQ
jgi:hypothetical protein